MPQRYSSRILFPSKARMDADQVGTPLAIKLKEKKPGQRACDEKDDKGKLCVGHLKRWFTPDEEVVKQVGKDVELFRCERCHALYRPAPNDDSSAGLRYKLRPVNLLGAFKKR